MNGKIGSIKVKWLYSIILTLPLSLGACSGEENTNEILQGNIPINFSGNVPVTRATQEVTTDSPERIGVFAYFTEGDFNKETAKPNFMFNQLVEKKTDGTWSYSPIKFWPNNSKTNRISFFAYAPYVEKTGDSNLSFQDKETAKGLPTLNYTVPTAENNQIDLLTATPVMNRTNGSVSFKLYHTLTKVKIYVKSNDDTPRKSITSFSVTGMKSGTLTYTFDSPQGWTWIYPSDEKETFTTNITNFPIADTTEEKKKLLATFFLLPNGERSTFNITYQYVSTDEKPITQIIKIDQPLPSTDNWTPGASVGYTIGIARKTITVKQWDTSMSWEEGAETETVEGTKDTTGS